MRAKRLYVFGAVIALMGVYVGGSVQAADTDDDAVTVSRSGKVVDVDGKSVAVEELAPGDVHVKYDQSLLGDYPRLVVVDGLVSYVVPFASLKSIVLTGKDKWTVQFMFAGRPQQVAGKLEKTTITGKLDQAALFSIESNRIKSLTFTDKADPKAFKKRIAYMYTLGLSDRSRVQVAGLKRYAFYHQNYMDRDVNPPVKRTREVHSHFANLKLMKGLAEHTIPFDSLRKIEFFPDKVVATGKNRKRATLKQSEHWESRITGYTGISAKGEVFVAGKSVSTIDIK